MSGSVYLKGTENSTNDDESQKKQSNIYGLTLNQKYSIKDDLVIIPILLDKFCSGEDRKLDLNFMKAKFADNINVENIDKLIAFERSTLDNASTYFLQDNSNNLFDEIGFCETKVSSMEDKIQLLSNGMKGLKSLIDSIK